MKLVWKLLRRHISIGQMIGFFFSNLFGMLIVQLSLQFYLDMRPILSEQSGAIKSDFLLLSKHVGGLGGSQTFSQNEIQEICSQRFVKRVGVFLASQYKVDCSLAIGDGSSFGTQMYFESVPDEFVSEARQTWSFDSVHAVVPIILPRNYLAIYNFGFAQSRSLPQISEGMASMVNINVRMRGNGLDEIMRARVVGFSSRINTILVPESFLKWSNHRYAPQEDVLPTRLIMEVYNPTDDAIPQYVRQKGYYIDEDKLDAGKITYFLKLLSATVMSVGLLISSLSFYILMLSIFLLVQKNTTKLQNLLLIGYSPRRVALPYQMLAVGVNLLVLIIALIMLDLFRSAYMNYIWKLFPMLQEDSMFPSIILGLMLCLFVCVLNVVAIRHKVMNIWNLRA